MIEVETIKRIAPYIVSVAVVGGALFAAYGHGVDVTKSHYEAIIAKAAKKHADEVIELQNEVRDVEHAHVEQMAEIAEQRQKDIQDAKQKLDAVISDYNAGTLRLRNKFTCKPVANTELPSAGSGTSGSDTGTQGGLQPEDVRFLVSEASRADDVTNQLTACQSVIKSYREIQKALLKSD